MRRRRHEYGMNVASTVGPRSTYTNISDEDLCTVISDALRILPNAGESYIIGACRSRSLHVQRWRIREAISTVDPVSRALRRTISVIRRTYSVPAPNSLWYALYQLQRLILLHYFGCNRSFSYFRKESWIEQFLYALYMMYAYLCLIFQQLPVLRCW